MIGILAVVKTRLVAQDNTQGGRGGAAWVRLTAAALLPLAVLQQRHLVGREEPPLVCCSERPLRTARARHVSSRRRTVALQRYWLKLCRWQAHMHQDISCICIYIPPTEPTCCSGKGC